MLKLLYLLPFPPRLDAAHGGSRVMAETLVRLAERHRLALLYFRNDVEDAPIDDLLRERCEIVQEVTRPQPRATYWQNWLLRARIVLGWIRGAPILATIWSVAAYREKLHSVLVSWQPDLIHIEGHMMGQYLPILERFPAPRVLVEYEPGALTARDLQRSARGFERLLFYLDRLAWERFERRVLSRVDTVVVFTERDRQAIASAAWTTPVRRVPLHTVLPDEPLDPIGRPPWRLLFIGNFIHPPNVDAALRLVQEIFPRVQEIYPEVQLDVVGGQPPQQLQGCTNQGVTVTGFVPDVTPFLDRAALIVVPLRQGGGMRVKVLEAIAVGKATVASPLAIEGLALSDGEHVVLAESDAEFVEKIAQLLSDPRQRARIAANARAWACAHFDWENSIAVYEQLHMELCHAQRETMLQAPSRAEVI